MIAAIRAEPNSCASEVAKSIRKDHPVSLAAEDTKRNTDV